MSDLFGITVDDTAESQAVSEAPGNFCNSGGNAAGFRAVSWIQGYAYDS